MFKRISDFANKQYLLSENQFGFREKIATYLAFLKLPNNITEELDTKYLHGHFHGLNQGI